MPLQPGDRFGRYEISELLGKGGMGEVYRAQDTLLHRRVALKILHPAAPGTGGASGGSGGPNKTDGAARILREARAAAGIEHTNAISIYDVGEVDGVPFLAMEFVSGKTLRPSIGDPTITLGRRIRWLVEIARALGAAHALGLVHRDIKPENVMVRDDGVVKVLDFGIARRTSGKLDPSAPTEASALGTLTADGVVVGTPFYMAPEQMRGEPLDGRADQFAWGVLAYELLTGGLPWERGSDGLQLVAQILSREIEPPRVRNPEIPAAVDSAIRMALSKAAASRFRDMEEVALALEPHAAVAGVPTARSHARRSIPVAEAESLAPTQAVQSGESAASAASVPSTRTQLATPGQRLPSAGGEAAPRWGPKAAIALAVLVAGAAVLRFTTMGRDAGTAPLDAAPPTSPADDHWKAAPGGSRMSSNAEASAAYRAGVQSLRDGSMQLATEQFDRAIELDTRFAAANLRRAQLGGQAHMARAMQNARSAREDLGEADRALLEAMEPLAQSPPDLKESERRLTAGATRYPTDADFPFELGWTLDSANASADARAAFGAALKLDPTLAAAWCMKARETVKLDDVNGAMAAYDECLKVSPGAMSCLDDLATLQANEGKCEEMTKTVRRLIALAPEEPESYGRLAQALFSAGEPIDAVRASLTEKWERLPAANRKHLQLLDEAQLALLSGQFDAAERDDRAYELEVGSSHNEVSHYVTAYDRMLIALETGRSDEALRIASEYLRRRSAWQPDALSLEPTIAVYAVQLAAGGLTPAAFGELRDQWLARDAKRVAQLGLVGLAGSGWAFAYALPAMTPADAASALAARPDVHPLIDALAESPYLSEPIGRTYLLAGKLDDAAGALTRASQSCTVLSSWGPLFSTWAAFDLGQESEARGDKTAACSAYRRVLQRWGAATPPSRTAAKTRARAKALKCEP